MHRNKFQMKMYWFHHIRWKLCNIFRLTMHLYARNIDYNMNLVDHIFRNAIQRHHATKDGVDLKKEECKLIKKLAFTIVAEKE